MPSILIATTNRGKIAEIAAILEKNPELTGVKFLTPEDLSLPLPDVEENGATFSENARLKARLGAQASGYIVIADDSGLCVDALNGEPGVQSARWAGPDATDADRIDLLLQKLSDLPQGERAARFVCVAAAATPDGREIYTEGVCEGIIAIQPRGEKGFGYDPVFLLPHLGRTMAELSPQEKNAISHRFQAFCKLIPRIHKLMD